MPILDLIAKRRNEQFALYDKYLNHQLHNVVKTLGFNKEFVRAEKNYLFDREGNRYLDLLSGYGVFNIGRNHPKMIKALTEVMQAELPNMVQFDCPILPGLFAEKLSEWMPAGINKFFFCNSGTESIEGAIKFARAATKRSKILYCDHAFHGLSTGSLALNGSPYFKTPFGNLIETTEVPLGDLEALEQALKTKEYACFVIEPIQGKGVYLPAANYFKEVTRLCQQYKTLLVVDEVQTGVGRTGKFFAFEHWTGAEPDIITMAKALSGGFIPVGVIAMKEWIFNKTYHNMENAVVHSSTFARNTLAMAAGITTLEILQEEKLIECAKQNGEQLLSRLAEKLKPYEMVKEVRGKGMMIGIEFCSPKSLKLKAGWALLDKANKGLFCQMIVIPLFKNHRILTQTAGHHSYVIKLIPPLTLDQIDIDHTVNAFEEVVAEAHRFPGAIWDFGTTLAKQALVD